MPQVSILSPTLYIFYISDIPEPGHDTTNILFSDDVTQIIEHRGNSKKELATRNEIKTKKINEDENKWKTQTNTIEFKILSISKLKPESVEIDGR